MTKATIFIGSPRKNGSTRILAGEAELGLREQGVETEIVFLNDLKIRGCQACYYCKKNNVAACAPFFAGMMAKSEDLGDCAV